MVKFLFNPNTTIENQEMALNLFKIADYYQIPHIKFASANYLINCDRSSVNSDEVSTLLMNVLAEAERQKSKEMMTKILVYILGDNDLDVNPNNDCWTVIKCLLIT